jgi:hypothetical protein
MFMGKASIKSTPAAVAAVAGLTVALVAAAVVPAGAASVFSGTAVVRSAAEDSAILVRCGPGGWGDAAASLAAVLPPGTLAVGGYYDSRSYGYSGSPPYYGDRYGAYYGCLDGYPVYYGYGPAPSYRYRSGYRHHRARLRATSAGRNGATR